tara:strand:+ start:428 stop:865 length:438 start_codon:yes stop_codon:yes gene_type:complete
MEKIKLDKINKLIDKYPYLYLPYLLKLKVSNKNKYEETLNSLALRHPNRSYLKSFLNQNINNEGQILDLFLKSKKRIRKNKKLDINTKDLSKPLLKKDHFISENLANIYIKQDKIDDAIKIYKKLSLINSKKKSYFAKKIKDLKK